MSADETVTASWLPSPLEGVDRLLVLYSPNRADLGRAVALGQATVQIGRVEEEGTRCLALEDSRMSRRHAVVEPDPERKSWRIRDLESRNGTFVDGERIESAELSDGCVIRVGAHLVLFQSLDHEACLRLFDKAIAYSSMVGTSHRLQRALGAIRAAATDNVPVLILGESGVGKELVARAVHDESHRDGAFVAVNCAALPENLIESELFGHARGAFTGANPRPGLFREAEGGTLFLDEIGEMRLDLQAKLLRAIVTGEIRPVGEDRPRQVDVRIIAATNLDLERAVDDGKFRGDLYARLMASVIDVPPLRDRRDDVLKLAQHFLTLAGCPPDLTPDAAEALLVYPWPFNVRELEHVLRAAGRAADSSAIDVNHLPARLQHPFAARRGASRPANPAPSPLLSIRRDMPPSASDLKEVLTLCDGNIARVAAFFRKDRRQVYRWAERLGVDMNAYRAVDDDKRES